MNNDYPTRVAVEPPGSAAVPVVDLFAGPGGLSEGFASLAGLTGQAAFRIGLSVEMDPPAHKTLELRALFRHFPRRDVPEAYYAYVRGEIARDELFQHPHLRAAATKARHEARNAELGETPDDVIDTWIRAAIGGREDWVLIGGPPCQAYSLVGRARRSRENRTEFEADGRHLLYQEYLRIIRAFAPAVFVMENVKGILSTQHAGTRLFEHIVDDLSRPRSGLGYELRSFVVAGASLKAKDLVVRAERYGVPQARHRVLIMGVRSDLAMRAHVPLSEMRPVTVREAIGDLPALRSRLSKRGKGIPDSREEWVRALEEAERQLKGWRSEHAAAVAQMMTDGANAASNHADLGGRYVSERGPYDGMPAYLREWLLDRRLAGACNHETRSHMRSDLHRYLFSTAFATTVGRSPTLDDFPARLLPEHQNVGDDDTPFVDRFRVQLADRPSTTVTSHIAKDGHAFIHPDPSQVRSLTVREAARLQTFPDNYFFEGGRTEQFIQVGNAVPPFLAFRIADAVARMLAQQARTSDLQLEATRAAA